MIDPTHRFRVNEKFVTSKIIDGEAIIINLATGIYFSLDKTGAAAWLLIGAGYGLADAADVLAKRYSAPAGVVATDLIELTGDLVKHGLILPAAADAPRAVVMLDASTGDTYQTPALKSYDDMGDVLALDPPLPQVEIEPKAWDASTK